jgi:hypothetical protein
MATADEPHDGRSESLHAEYVLDVRIVEVRDDGVAYRFEAPEHRGRTFEDPERAELYADVYFDVNGFAEAGTGERGVPPVVIGAGRDTLAAYFLTMPGIDRHWVASFFGCKPPRVERYVGRVRSRADEIREKARAHGVEPA